MDRTQKIAIATATTIVGGFLALIVIVIVARVFFFGYHEIPQNGMYPTLPAGARLFVNKRAYGNVSDVKRGDIIVFDLEENGHHYDYIWRVVGLPGETVVTSGESVSINGKMATHIRVREEDVRNIFREEIGDASYEVAFIKFPLNPPNDMSITVPPDHFFVMGDNRMDARDSRVLGPIAFSSISGRKW